MSKKVMPGDAVIHYAVVWTDGDRIWCVDQMVDLGWEPDPEFGVNTRVRGDVIGIARVTRHITGFYKYIIPGDDAVTESPRLSEPVFEILKCWRWTGRRWKEI